MSELTIVIVNWNSGRQLHDCLKSIFHARHDDFTISEVVVVDNASTDDSLDGVDQLGLPVRILQNSANRGFAVACNQGAAMASGKYLLFLNPDTRLFENSLLAPFNLLEDSANQDVGVVGIQLLDGQNRIARSCARFPDFGIFAAQALGLNRLPGLRHLSVHMTDWEHDRTARVDHVIGAFYWIRRGLFESLGGFDERFFVYLEDLDLSFRVNRAGWRSIFLSEAQAFHEGGGSSSGIKALRLFYSLRSRLLYGFKHLSRPGAWGLLLITLVAEPWIRCVFALLRGSWSEMRHTTQAYALLIKALPETVFPPRPE